MENKKYLGICVHTDYFRRSNRDFCMMLPYPIECTVDGFIPDGVVDFAKSVISKQLGTFVIFKGIYTCDVSSPRPLGDFVDVTISGTVFRCRLVSIFESLFKYL